MDPLADEVLQNIKTWLVNEPMVFIMPRPDVSQTMHDKLAVKCKGAVIEGDAVRLDGVAWLMTKLSGEDGHELAGWVLIDGVAKGTRSRFLDPIAG
mmetsp:Transcript_41487/g.95365  ORF Transcript_41487/g.95365 Transcript_41487/m.95365 type:complete len:96 (-) Transcript_41487:34-321(-)